MSAYRKVGVQSGVTDADPHQLISMLLEGALDRIAGARGAMERKESARQGELIGGAISIVDTMRASLDYEKGGEIAANLGSLYDYMERRLLEASSKTDLVPLEEVSTLLKNIKSGWDGIGSQSQGS